jgi:hypothetical protein
MIISAELHKASVFMGNNNVFFVVNVNVILYLLALMSGEFVKRLVDRTYYYSYMDYILAAFYAELVDVNNKKDVVVSHKY